MSFRFINYIARLFSSNRSLQSEQEKAKEQEVEQQQSTTNSEVCGDDDTSTNHFELRHSIPITIPQCGWRQKTYGFGTQ